MRDCNSFQSTALTTLTKGLSEVKHFFVTHHRALNSEMRSHQPASQPAARPLDGGFRVHVEFGLSCGVPQSGNEHNTHCGSESETDGGGEQGGKRLRAISAVKCD